MDLDLISDWLYCFFTSHPAYIVAHFWNFCSFFLLLLFLVFWFQNCRYCESSQSKPSQTVRYLLHSDRICLGSSFVSSHLAYSKDIGHFSSKFSHHNFTTLYPFLAVKCNMPALPISETAEPPVHSKCLFHFHWEVIYSVFSLGMVLWIAIDNVFIRIYINIS